MTVDRRLAFHEAGHAVMAHILGLKVLEIVMSQNPAYVNIADFGNRDNDLYILFIFCGMMAELKLDPDNINYHDIGEHDDTEIKARLWDLVWRIDAPMAIIARSHSYFTSSIERFLDVPDIWQQITILAEVLMDVDRLDGPEVTQILEVAG